MDIWRVQHQRDRNYSYYSNIHDSYDRIDYFFVNQSGRTMAISSDIGGFLWSDHAPIYLEIKVIEHVKAKGNWSLNDNLLKDKDCIEDIRKTIREFLPIHEKDETSPPMQWKTLKCVLRGTLIKHGSRLKKSKEQKKPQLINEIEKLDKEHKRDLNPLSKIKLKSKRLELQAMLDKESLRIREKNKAQWYQYGNKTGKILAKILKDQQPSISIIKILKSNGKLTYEPKEILKEFHTYYSNLYNIKRHQGNKEEEKKGEEIKKIY